METAAEPSNEIKLNFNANLEVPQESRASKMTEHKSNRESADGGNDEEASNSADASRASGVPLPKKRPVIDINHDDDLTDEELIVKLATEIDTNITALDEKLDSVLERHEKEFLTAYRFHMLKVQGELTALK